MFMCWTMPLLEKEKKLNMITNRPSGISRKPSKVKGNSSKSLFCKEYLPGHRM